LWFHHLSPTRRTSIPPNTSRFIEAISTLRANDHPNRPSRKGGRRNAFIDDDFRTLFLLADCAGIAPGGKRSHFWGHAGRPIPNFKRVHAAPVLNCRQFAATKGLSGALLKTAVAAVKSLSGVRRKTRQRGGQAWGIPTGRDIPEKNREYEVSPRSRGKRTVHYLVQQGACDIWPSTGQMMSASGNSVARPLRLDSRMCAKTMDALLSRRYL
jgi:hypothetical protein